MKVVMDADCLIKLAKAGLKERVCRTWQVTIPEKVRQETTDHSPDRPDATRIRDNIAAGMLTVDSESGRSAKGEVAALALYQTGNFDLVATDDARFIRHLRGLSIPYAVPAAFVVHLRASKALPLAEAREALEALRPHISAEEYAMARMAMSEGGTA